MKKNYKQILFEGDEDPKVNIICDVLNEGLRAEFRENHNKNIKNVVLMHCNSVSHIEYRDNTEIYSPLVPYGTVITMYFSTRNKDLLFFDEIVFMEPYPFTLGEKIRGELEEVNSIVKANSRAHFKILFYRNTNQRSGVGDIVGIDQALQEAPDQIKANMSDIPVIDAIQYCVYRTPRDLVDVVHGGCGNLSVAVSACTERFRTYSERIKPEKFYGEYGEYKDILEFSIEDKYSVLLQTESINKLTKFRKVKGCNDVIKQYVKNYIEAYQGLILDLIEEVYIEIVGDICFWNLEKDLISLKEGAKKIIEKNLMDTFAIKEKCPQYEADYNERIRNTLKLDTQFEEKAISLINREMMDYLYTYLLRKEELLSKTFS